MRNHQSVSQYVFPFEEAVIMPIESTPSPKKVLITQAFSGKNVVNTKAFNFSQKNIHTVSRYVKYFYQELFFCERCIR